MQTFKVEQKLRRIQLDPSNGRLILEVVSRAVIRWPLSRFYCIRMHRTAVDIQGTKVQLCDWNLYSGLHTGN